MSGRKNRRRKNKYFLYVCFLLIISVSILLMPYSVASEGETYVPVYITGGLFWGGIIGLAFTVFSINRSRKASLRKEKAPSTPKQLGIIHFFKNTPAKIADIMMILSLVCFIVCSFITNNIFIQFIIIAVFVFSFGMHCLLNGVNYIYIKGNVRRERTSWEKVQESKTDFLPLSLR